ncbi:glycosyltransferase family 2 protein [Terrimonas alba]|uniref:glycosyltransferase family 2 protein n=1 Tax=Terrimonas alba TaxID=3349636 RepID=UPI0035F34596
MPLPKCAIVILNWNGRNFLEQFLPSVCRSTYGNYDLVVADNNSTDDSISFLKQHYPSVRIISLAENFGFAKGYNEALKQVDADYFILLNSDVEVTPGWIEPMVGLLENNASIAACQPKILSFHNKKMFEYAGAAGGWIDKYGYPFSRGRVFDTCEEDRGQYDQAAPVFWASGACLFIRAAVFQQMNGFDDFFFAHQEEIDLCWRMQLAGYKIYSCPASIVYHVGGGTLPKGNSKKTFLNFRNNLIMLSKNVPSSKKNWLIPYRILLDMVAAFKELLSGDAGYFRAVMKAHCAFIKWRFSPAKNKTSAIISPSKLDGYISKSIIWQYFIRKKKTFFEIADKTG